MSRAQRRQGLTEKLKAWIFQSNQLPLPLQVVVGTSWEGSGAGDLRSAQPGFVALSLGECHPPCGPGHHQLPNSSCTDSPGGMYHVFLTTESASVRCVCRDWGGAAIPGLAQALICSMIFQRLPMCQVLGWEIGDLWLGGAWSLGVGD